MELRANPFCDRGLWYWRDDKQVSHGPYSHQMAALRDLLRAHDTRTRWERFKDLVSEFIHS